MVNIKFKESYERLNAAQKMAVDTIEGPVMVIAGPGTGKTQILTLRIANILLTTQVNPENILALTFTQSGALTMRRRLVEMIGSAGYRVEINTFHGFCNEVIKRNPEDFTDLISSENITEVEQIKLIEEILESSTLELLKPLGDPLYYTLQILTAINDLKKENVGSQDFQLALEEQKKEFAAISDLYHDKGKYKGEMKGKYLELQREMAKNEELVKVYERYQSELQKRKRYDFNDMLMKVLIALKTDHNLLLRLQETYQYILVDEHQDTNTAQNKLIELLGNFYDNPNLFIVGDEKQSIYRFQGASLENFLYFQNLYPQAALVPLSENYRSTQVILNAAGSLISQNSTAKLLPTDIMLRSQKQTSGEKVKVISFSDYQSEYHFLVTDIKTKIAQGVPLKEIAILCRNNRDLQPVIAVLEQYGIAYNVESDQNILTDYDVRKLLLIFEAVVKYGSDLEFFKAIHVDFLNIDPLDVYKLMQSTRKSKISVADILSSEDKIKELNLVDPKQLTWFFNKLKDWNRQSFNDSLDRVFKDILNESEFLKYILGKLNYLDILDKITALFEEVRLQVEKNPKFSLANFLDYLETLQAHDLAIKKVSRTIIKDGVRLMTAHRSKGLEFDYVYLINAYDGHWGNQRKRSRGFKIPWEYLGIKIKGLDLDENEDERRLFYVALTRARLGIGISYSTISSEGKEQIPSQFISEIGEDFFENTDVSEFEQSFLTKKETTFLPTIDFIASKKEVELLESNKVFLQELFLEQGLSVTSLNNYLECPWKYFYRNLLVLPDAKENSLIFGSAIHLAINSYLRALKLGTATKQLMINTFLESLSLGLGEGEDFRRFAKRGSGTLETFYEQEAKNWTKDFLSELSIKGVKLGENVTLNGKIDMIEPKSSTGEVMVYDFKTGKPKTRGEVEGSTKSGDGNYKRQLIFYKILLDQYQQGRFNMKEGVISFVESDDKGKYHKEIFSIEEPEVLELQELIFKVAGEIYELTFWDQFCDDLKCEYCLLRKVMVG